MWTWSADGPSHVTVHVTKLDCFIIRFFTAIDHSWKYHNIPYCSLFIIPKFCVSIVFSFSLGHFKSQEKLKTMLIQNFGVTNKEHMVCYGIFWSGQLDLSTIKLQVITIRFFTKIWFLLLRLTDFLCQLVFFSCMYFKFFYLPWVGTPHESKCPVRPFPFWI